MSWLHFSICTLVIVTTSYCDDPKRVKRTEFDLQTCIDSFDVHKDKIIRTQDSRDMGAKYLNEIDLGSREECLRLCCETDTCDVFVFEEKSPGSCYLFHCGPPEDFKCKFTRHVNYSSAVLAINRHNELETQIKMTKHEQDLTRLRKLDEVPVKVNPPPPAIHSTVHPAVPSTPRTAPVSKELLPITSVKHTGRACSIYQFECRSTSECIAIYNACDGIPQCADGSDEAPELSCPVATIPPAPAPSIKASASAAAAAAAAATVLKPRPRYENGYEQAKYENSPHTSSEMSALSKENIDPQQRIQPLNHVALPEHNYERSDLGAQIPPPRALPVAAANYGDASLLQSPNLYRQPPLSQNAWIPHQSNQMPVPVLPQNTMQYSDQNSHIFNHKVNSIQVGDPADSMSAMQYGDPNSHDFPKLPNYFNSDVYRPQMQLPESWQAIARAQENLNNPYQPPENWQSMQMPQSLLNRQGPQPPPFVPDMELPPNWKAPKQPDAKPVEHHEKTSQEVAVPAASANNPHLNKGSAPTENVNHAADKTNKTAHHNASQKHHTPVASEFQMSEDIILIDIKDGEADRPSGAILSLTLGLCITTVMVIIVGCRLRVVRKRMRRGGKSPYAHDADYLVNGMYL